MQQGSDEVGLFPFQAKEAILEMDSYCKCTLSACFAPNGAHLLSQAGSRGSFA